MHFQNLFLIWYGKVNTDPIEYKSIWPQLDSSGLKLLLCSLMRCTKTLCTQHHNFFPHVHTLIPNRQSDKVLVFFRAPLPVFAFFFATWDSSVQKLISLAKSRTPMEWRSPQISPTEIFGQMKKVWKNFLTMFRVQLRTYATWKKMRNISPKWKDLCTKVKCARRNPMSESMRPKMT